MRGLDYYTKTVFEIKAPGSLGSQDTICGGGRYDKLIELLGGKPTPGIGFGSGIERIVLTLQAQNIRPPAPPRPAAVVTYLGQEARIEAGKLVAQLRQTGLVAYSAFGDRSLKAQMKSAGRSGARYAVIIGQDELARGVATVRNLDTKAQTDVPLTQIGDYLS
ncbi:MAG: His/Gly/Thr/Pro-type tRNA ligase C-terminal domain-containing protein [Anaerolineae bacterium]